LDANPHSLNLTMGFGRLFAHYASSHYLDAVLAKELGSD